MKRLCFLLIAWLTVLGLSAQSYNQYWKKIEVALRADHPQTAIALLDTICHKAIDEQQDGWLLRAMLVRYTCYENLSPDSAKVALQQFENQLDSVQDATTRALWNASLARIYAQKAQRDTTACRKAQEHIKASLNNFEILTHERCTAFPELFNQGKDSRYFSDDLLSVVALTGLDFYESYQPVMLWELLQCLQQHYRRKGLPAATLLTTLDSIDRAQHLSTAYTPEKALQRLKALTTEYQEEEANVETYLRIIALPSSNNVSLDSIKYKEAQHGWQRYRKQPRAAGLQNYLRETEQPTLSLQGVASLVYPGETFTAHIEARNVEKAEVRIFSLHTDAVRWYQAGNSPDHEQWLKQQKRGKAQKHQLQLSQQPPYAPQKDSIRLSLSQPGIYLLQIRANGKLLDEAVLACSQVRTISTTLPDSSTRLQIVDAQSGHPITGRFVFYDHQGQKLATQPTDATGELRVKSHRLRQQVAFAQTNADCYSAPVRLHQHYNASPHSLQQHIQLYTDRSIYRPGQKIYCGGLFYTQLADNVEVAENRTLQLTLYNAQGKAIETQQVQTNEMGCFDATFSLPAACLPGRFRLQADYSKAQSSLSLQVEEYRRPSFFIETHSPQKGFQWGDTIIVDGSLKTYSGLPIEKAKVKWSATRHYYFRSPSVRPQEVQGETFSNADGVFYIPLSLPSAEETVTAWQNSGYYRIEIEATAPNGETVHTTHTLRGSYEAYTLLTSWPEWMLKEKPEQVSITIQSNTGKVASAEGEYTLWYFTSTSDSTKVGSYKFRSGVAFHPEGTQQLPSGHYKAHIRLVAPDGRILCQSKTFHLYGLTDRRPLSRIEFLQHTDVDPETGHVHLTLASSADSVVLFYDLLTRQKVLESRQIHFSDSILHFSLPYHERYADGATLHLAFVKNGKLYATSATILKPTPQKQLQLSWHTFRSYVVPGGHEEWKLRVTHSDGTPANAALMARLYDRSLDAIAPAHSLFNGLYFPRYLFHPSTSTQTAYPVSLYGQLSAKLLEETPWQPTRWKEELLTYPYGTKGYTQPRVLTSGKPALMMKNAVLTEVVFDATDNVQMEGSGVQTPTETSALRTDFSETAFFMPRLCTDTAGIVSLVFTLPQSLTTWQFNALAHTSDMHWATLDTTVVARKQWMISPAMPRFLYSNDHSRIPATLHNLTDKPQSATVVMEWRDAQTTAMLHRQQQLAHIEAHASKTVYFDFSAPKSSTLLSVRTTASAPGFTDGEEHLLPVFGNETEVVRTLPFTLTDTLQHTLRIDTLWRVSQASHRRLTVEVSGNPTWYAVTALPAIAQNNSEDALSLATDYYALTMAMLIAQQQPAIRDQVQQLSEQATSSSSFLQTTATTEMPWFREELAERERLQRLTQLFDIETTTARRYTALDRLKALQQPDGSWSWFKGMRGNRRITLDVALLLARLEVHTTDASAHAMMQKAMNFLHTEFAREVEREKKETSSTSQPEALHSQQLQYLYLCTLTNDLRHPHVRTLLQRLGQIFSFMSLLDKAYATNILAHNGQSETALYHAQGLLEHTLLQNNQARCFDSKRAPIAATSYRIPLQVATIEAIEACCKLPKAPVEHFRESMGQMRLWLLLSKRTQSWETSRATTDAVHLLLHPSSTNETLIKPTEASSLLSWNITQRNQVIATSTDETHTPSMPIGHSKASFLMDAPETKADSLLAKSRRSIYLGLQQNHRGLAWGNVTVSLTQPAPSTTAFGAGMQVARHFEVYRNGQWAALQPTDTLAIGERVREVCTLTTDADYDFLHLRAPHPACLTPAQPLSGYTFAHGRGSYRVVRDAATERYFDALPKGTHILTEEYFVDRAGTYHSGLTQVECVYAPEFRAHTSDEIITCK